MIRTNSTLVQHGGGALSGIERPVTDLSHALSLDVDYAAPNTDGAAWSFRRMLGFALLASAGLWATIVLTYFMA